MMMAHGLQYLKQQFQPLGGIAHLVDDNIGLERNILKELNLNVEHFEVSIKILLKG
jgi:hypothetical protein